MTQLYLISPPSINPVVFAKTLADAIEGGASASASVGAPALSDVPCERQETVTGTTKNLVGAFQLRLKEASDKQIVAATEALLPVCRKAGVAFVMNDRVDLAVKLGCDGVHVGQEDLQYMYLQALQKQGAPMPSAEAELPHSEAIKGIRNFVGRDIIIGVTCHASRHLAMEAGEAGADYVAFGAFYDTTSKPAEKLAKWGTPTPEILTWWNEFMTLPSVAIGGITPANCAPLVKAGADFIAVITAVWNHPAGAKQAVKEFNAVILSEA